MALRNRFPSPSRVRSKFSFVDKAVCGDCRAILQRFPDNSVDLIVTSPPYADNRKSTYQGVPIDEYVYWFLGISKELYRVLKPNGSFILNIKERVIDGQRGTYVYELVRAMKQQGWLWTEEYIWKKKNTSPGKWPNRFRDLWEHCYHFTKSKKFVMHQSAVREPVKNWAKMRLANLSKTDKTRSMSRTGSGFGKNVSNWVGRKYVNPGNVIETATESSNMSHSAAYPVSLPTWFIKLFSRKDALVLDPFLGSGTTAVAALRLQRHYTGIELSRKYWKIACKRISREKKLLKESGNKERGIHR